MSVKTNILLKLSNFVDSVITFAKLQNIATNKILGRTTAGSGVIEELDIASYSNKLIPLTTTFADCENTASETTIVTVTIPANSLELGDIIEISIIGQRLQNSGGAINITQKIKANSSNIHASNATSVANNSSTYYLTQYNGLEIISVSGNNLTFRTNATNSISTPLQRTAGIALAGTTTASGVSSANEYTLGSIDKTATITITLTAQWASANANAWVRVQQAQAYIIKKAV